MSHRLVQILFAFNDYPRVGISQPPSQILAPSAYGAGGDISYNVPILPNTVPFYINNYYTMETLIVTLWVFVPFLLFSDVL